MDFNTIQQLQNEVSVANSAMKGVAEAVSHLYANPLAEVVKAHQSVSAYSTATSAVAKYVREQQAIYKKVLSPAYEIMERYNRFEDIVNPPALRKMQEHAKLMERLATPFKEIRMRTEHFENAFASMRSFAYETSKLRELTDMISAHSKSLNISAEIQKATAGLSFQNVGRMFNWADGRTPENLSVENFTFGSEREEDTEVAEARVDEGSRIKRIIIDLYKERAHLSQVHHHDFELMIGELLSDRGYRVEYTKRTRDGGYDLIALMPVNGMLPIRYLVECKHWKDKVGVNVVRSLMSVFQNDDSHGMLVTSSYFTPDAYAYRDKYTPYSFELKDHDTIVGWIRTYSGIYLRG